MRLDVVDEAKYERSEKEVHQKTNNQHKPKIKAPQISNRNSQITLTLLLDYLIKAQLQSCNVTVDIQVYCPLTEISFSFLSSNSINEFN